MCFFRSTPLKTRMDREKGLTLSYTDEYSASPAVVHYAAFCSTVRLRFRLQICQPGCHGSQWSDKDVPITKDISVLFSRGKKHLFQIHLEQHKDSELNAAISLFLPKDK